MISDPYIEAKLAEERKANMKDNYYNPNKLSASEEMQQAIALEIARARSLPRQRQVSQKVIDKRRKAAKVARKQRKRNNG